MCGQTEDQSTLTADETMFEITVEPGKPVLVLKASGLMRADDYLECMPEFDNQIAGTNPKGLLLDWTELKEWGEDTKSIAFLARIEHRSKFVRTAVLANATWTSEISDLEQATRRPVRRFPTSERQSAMTWLDAIS